MGLKMFGAANFGLGKSCRAGFMQIVPDYNRPEVNKVWQVRSNLSLADYIII
jgi:hypothetical protein